MDEKDFLKHIKQLRKLEPSAEVLSSIKLKALSRITKRESFFVRVLTPVSLLTSIPILVMLVFILLGIQHGSFVRAVEIKFAEVRLVFSSNQYVRAQIATNLLPNALRHQSIQKDISEKEVERVRIATALGFKELSKLNLMGEPGQYTTAQCQSLYAGYDEYLKKLLLSVEQHRDTTKRPKVYSALEGLTKRINEYEHYVDAQLEAY